MSVSHDQALRWLERLRLGARADHALLWLVTDTGAVAALRSGRTGADGPAPAFFVDGPKTAIDRLRRNGLVCCDIGEVSGVEDFAPAGANSFVAAGANRDDRLASVLVLGWSGSLPPCGPSAFAQLRIAAALLDRATSSATGSHGALTIDDAERQAAKDSITIVDPGGIPAARTVPDGAGAGDASGRAARYLERCRRAATEGSAEAAVAIRGIEAVSSGAGSFFQTALQEPDRKDVTIITATALPAPGGGAVVAYANLVPATIANLTGGVTLRGVNRFLDALPVSIWIATLDGRVTCASRRWEETVGDGAAASSRPRQWCDPVHASDRPRAAAAFDAAVERREELHLELRLRGADGRYRWSACVAAPILAADGSVECYVGAFVDISGQRRAEAALARVAAKLLAAQEAERSRIARELHDDLGQQVVLLDAALEPAIGNRFSRAQMESTLLTTRLRLREIAGTIHALAHRLHPAKLKLLGLVPTLQALCRQVATEARQEVVFEAAQIPSHLDEQVVLCLFRVAQEALQNVVKHGGARRIAVQLKGTGESLQLTITDDGSGFDPLVTPSAGLGLLTMRERVELAGGTLAVTSVPGRGTTIEATLNTSPGDVSAARRAGRRSRTSDWLG